MADNRREDLSGSHMENQWGMIRPVEMANVVMGRAAKARRVADPRDDRSDAEFPRQMPVEDTNQRDSDSEEWDSDGSGGNGEGDGNMSDSDVMDDESESEDEYSSSSSEESDEDEQRHELSEKTLLQIQRGDPEVTSLEVHCFHSHVDGEKAGRCIGGSASLKKLAIEGDGLNWMADSRLLGWFQELCGGIARNRSIEQYSWRDCDLADASAVAAMATLSTWFEHNDNLQSLEITGCAIGNDGTRLLASALSRRRIKSSVQRIKVDANEIGDNSGKELIEALKGYDNLLEISLRNNEIGRRGCHALRNLLQDTNLEKVNLAKNYIDDAGIAVLTGALANNSSLKVLDLGHNDKITANGWQMFFARLEGAKFAIKELDLCGDNITNEVMAAMARALANNETLEFLILGDNSSITSKGWSSLSHLLCDNSSATGIRASNHTLRHVDIPSVPEYVYSLMRLNQRQCRRDVTREKIIRYHFRNGASNVQECLGMDLAVLPHVISWMGRDESGHGLLYETLRHHPAVFVRKTAERASGAKRKRVW